MTLFRKKPVVVTAITFDQLVAHGIAAGGNVVNGMPWSFQYNGHPITHENDDCYLIPTLEGVMKMGRDDMLITGVKGEIYPCKREIFDATYDPEKPPVADQAGKAVVSDVPPHQQRVLAEKTELDDRLTRLQTFFSNSIFSGLPADEQDRLQKQAIAMQAYSEVLGERIEAFGATLITLPVMDPGPDSIEQEIQAKASKAPRVTPADVDAAIASEFYFTAADGVLGESEMGTRPAAWTNLDQVTICVLVLCNGAKVLGVNYGAIDRAQHDAAMGREEARKAAVEKVWELLGFRLRDKLTAR